MIRVIKHILVEPTADRSDRLDTIRATILAAFPDATTEIVPGLLDDDLVVEVRVPLSQLDEWQAVRKSWGDFSTVGHDAGQHFDRLSAAGRPQASAEVREDLQSAPARRPAVRSLHPTSVVDPRTNWRPFGE